MSKYTFLGDIWLMKSMLKYVLIAVSLAVVSPAFAAQTLVLATRSEALTNRFSEQVLAEAYARLNIKVEFVRYPGARSVVEANKGNADGEVARLSAVLKNYKNLRHVPVPLFSSELSAFVRDGYASDFKDWSSLNGEVLATVRGFKLVENKLKDQNLTRVDTTENAVIMLQSKRVNVAILNRLLGILALTKTAAENIKVIDPPLERLPVFHLLHQKHEALIPKITAELKVMEADGSIDTMWKAFTLKETIKAAQ